MNWYERVMEKPKAYRRKVAYFVAVFLGIFFFSIWIILTSYSIKNTFKNQNNNNLQYKALESQRTNLSKPSSNKEITK